MTLENKDQPVFDFLHNFTVYGEKKNIDYLQQL